MQSHIMNPFEVFHYYWTEVSDPRTRDWFTYSSVYPIPFIFSIYLYTVLYWGPQYMKNKPPYSLNTFMKVYNIFQIVVNAWLVREHIAAGWLTDIPIYTCIPLNYSYEPRKYKLVMIFWWVLLLKIIDCTETVVFMLRKKYEQISVLHLYHHMSTIILIWIGGKYVAGEMASFVTLVNCNVHVIMYIYYFIATFGPRVRAIIAPIKRYITILQMVQFLVLVLFVIQTYSVLPNCNISTNLANIFTLNVIINWYLFYKFYRKAYTSKVK